MKKSEIKLELVAAANIHNSLVVMLDAHKFPFDIAWTLQDIVDAMHKHAERYEKAREEIVKKYGKPAEEKGENGAQQYQIEDMDNFRKEMEKLNLMDVELTVPLLKYEDLRNLKDIQFSGSELAILRKYFIDMPDATDDKVKSIDNGKPEKANLLE